MRLNIVNNYKTIYYNFLVSFYLCLNCVLPYYDDVIISLQSQAIKLLIKNDKLNIKKVKKIRMIEFIDTLNKSDKIILDKEKDIILIDYCIYECHDNSTGAESTESTESTSGTDTGNDSNTNETEAKDGRITSSNSDPDDDPYEPRKKKSRIDNDYMLITSEQMKDKDNYYNIGVNALSTTAATVAAAAKYLIEDSVSNSADSTDSEKDELNKQIDISINNAIEGAIYDKNKDD